MDLLSQIPSRPLGIRIQKTGYQQNCDDGLHQTGWNRMRLANHICSKEWRNTLIFREIWREKYCFHLRCIPHTMHGLVYRLFWHFHSILYAKWYSRLKAAVWGQWKFRQDSISSNHELFSLTLMQFVLQFSPPTSQRAMGLIPSPVQQQLTLIYLGGIFICS